MLIVCPSCATSYMIDPAAVGTQGRTVRCVRCKTTWLAGGPKPEVASFVADVIGEAEARGETPAPRSTDDFGEEPTAPAASLAAGSDLPAPTEAPAAEQHDIPPEQAPPLVPAGIPPPEETSIDPDNIENFAARRERMHVRRKVKRRSSKWTAIILVLFGFNVALVGARNEVVRYLPQTSSLFAAIGLPVNLRHLTFEDVRINKEEHDGVAVLAVEGTIVSLASAPVEVPRLRFAVRNAGGQEIYSWTALPARSILNPGEKLAFRSRLASPPADASDVLVRFFTSRDVSTGGK